MLFRLAFMVDEKRLGPVLAFVSGKVINMEAPVPVAMVDNRPYTELIDLSGRKKITTKEITAQIVASGKDAKATAYAVKQLIAARRIKPNGERGCYTVIASPKTKKGK